MWEFANTNPGTVLLMFIVLCITVVNVVQSICDAVSKEVEEEDTNEKEDVDIDPM